MVSLHRLLLSIIFCAITIPQFVRALPKMGTCERLLAAKRETMGNDGIFMPAININSFSFEKMVCPIGSTVELMRGNQNLEFLDQEILPMEVVGPDISSFSKRIVSAEIKARKIQGSPTIKAMTLNALRAHLEVIRHMNQNTFLARSPKHSWMDTVLVRRTDRFGIKVLGLSDIYETIPNEAYAWSLHTTHGWPIRSEIRKGSGFEISGSEISSLGGDFLSQVQSLNSLKFKILHGQPRYWEFIHSHPQFEYELFDLSYRTDDGQRLTFTMTTSFNIFPLSPDDIDVGRKLSMTTPIPVMITAITPNGIRYSALFLNGKNITDEIDAQL